MQAVTDAAYADFLQQMAAKGFTIADPAALFGSEKVAKLKPVAQPYDVSIKLDPKKDSKGKATFFKPTAMPGMIVLAGDITGSSMFAGFSQIGAGMDAQMAISDFAKTSGTSVVNVTYVIDFSQLKRPGAFSFGGLEVNSGMAVVGDYSRAVITTPAYKMATLIVQSPVVVEGDFAEKKDETKDGALQSAANVAGGVAAAFGMGGLMFGKSKTFSFTAKPAYQDGRGPRRRAWPTRCWPISWWRCVRPQARPAVALRWSTSMPRPRQAAGQPLSAGVSNSSAGSPGAAIQPWRVISPSSCPGPQPV